MSWTIEKTNSNEAAVDRLEKAIRTAAENNILMFCASRDDGQIMDSKSGPYPAASDTKKIFRIGAAIPSGDRWKWVNLNAVNFLFPGVELSEMSADLASAQSSSTDGSSTATALASGLAALILLCVKWAKPDKLPFMKNFDRMKNVLGYVVGQNKTKYVQVWDLFDEVVQPHRGHRQQSDEEVLKSVAERICLFSDKKYSDEVSQ
jgi:hypothetical protein